MVSALHANLISCRVGFLLSCFCKSNSSYLFCAVICSALVICSVNRDYVAIRVLRCESNALVQKLGLCL